jgi:hypothetical protein
MNGEGELAKALALPEEAGLKWAARVLRGAGGHDIRHQQKRDEDFEAKKRGQFGFSPLEPLKPLREIKRAGGQGMLGPGRCERSFKPKVMRSVPKTIASRCCGCYNAVRPNKTLATHHSPRAWLKVFRPPAEMKSL